MEKVTHTRTLIMCVEYITHTESLWDNGDGTFDAVVTVNGDIAAEWRECPSLEYAEESLEEFEVEVETD